MRRKNLKRMGFVKLLSKDRPLNLLIVLALISFLSATAEAAGEGWLTGYTYRRAIVINNTGSDISEDFQVKIDDFDTYALVNATPSKMLASGNDIRFTRSDGTTDLPYWIESGMNTTTTDIWVKVTAASGVRIPAGNSIIYIYYGNASASSASSGTSTFEFFDDFNSYTDGDLNGQGGWSGNVRFDIQGTVYNGASGKAVEQGNSWPSQDVITHNINSIAVGHIIMYMRVTNTNDIISTLHLKESGTLKLGVQATGSLFYYLDSAGGWSGLPTSTDYAANTWYKIEIIFDATTDKYLSIKINDVEKASTQPTSRAFTNIDAVEIVSYGNGTLYSYYDDIRVSKYASLEPTCTPGSEEESIPPGAITDLVANPGSSEGKINLSWSAVGDDNYSGNITGGRYRIAYSSVSVSESVSNYNIELTTDTIVGQNQYYMLTGLTNGTTYYIRIWTADEVPNWSLTSNGATTWAQIDIIIPGTITDLTATQGPNESEINLCWSAVGDNNYSGNIASGKYRIAYSSVSVSESVSNYNIELSTNTTPGQNQYYMLTGLTNGTTYYIRIWTADELPNWSLTSNGATTWAQIDTIIPGTITDLSATPGTSEGKINLSWSAVGDNNYSGNITAGRYRIAYSSVSVSESVSNYSIELSTNTIPGQNQYYTLTGLINGTTYYVRVWTADEVPNWSNISNGATTYAMTDIVNPGPITDLSASTTAVEGEVRLNWTAVGDNNYSGNITAGRYRIAYSSVSVSESVSNYSIELSTNTIPGQNQYYTLTGLINGTTYYVRVWTADEVPNWSNISNGATTYAMPDIVNPGTITDLASSATAVEGEVRLNWTAVGDNGYNGSSHHYQLRYTANAGINWTTEWNTATIWNDNLAVSGAVGTAETTIINGLTKETTYYFGIKSVDEAGNASAVSSVSGYARDLTPPNAINNLTAVSNGYGRQIKLSWSSPGDDGGSGNITNGKYRIAYSSVSVSDSVNNYNIELTTNTTPGQNQSYTITGLSGGTTYYFRVWARDNEANWSANSNSASALTEVVRRLVFISPAVVVSAGNYSLNISTVQIQDENNNPVNVSGFTTLVLETTSSQGKFSLDKITPINEITISPGNNSFSFYYYDETVGNPTMTIKHKTLNWYNATQTASVVSGGVIRFQVDCPNSGDVGIARTATISARDVYNNIVSTYSGTVNLHSDKNIILPANLNFTAADNGQKTLPVIDNYVEHAKIIAEESTNPAIWGESGILDWYGVQVVATNLAPANVRQGEQDVGMEKLIVATSSGSCVFKGIKLKKSGSSIADSDISLAKIYHDTGNGLFEVANDLLLSSGVFSSGNSDLGGMNETISETPRIYYLVYDFANSANRGKTVGTEITYANNLTVEGRKVGINNFPITSQNTAIESAQLIMDLKVESKIKTPLRQGSQNVVVERYAVWSTNGSTGWQKMGLILIGSGSDKDVGSVKLYKKNSFGTVTLDADGGVQAVFVSSGIFSSGALTLNFNPVETIDSTTQYYYLTYDISGEATVGATVGASGNATNFDLGGVDKVAETDLPYSSDLATINPTIDTVTVSGLDLLAVQIKQGSKNRAFAKLNLKTSANSAILKSIKIKKLGTLLDSEIPAAKIYKEDTSANEWLDIGGGTTAAVKLVSGGTDLFNSGEAGINLVSGEVINPAGKNFYIVVELSESATVGGTIGIRIEQAGIGVDSPDLVAGTNLPLETKQAQISDNPDTLTVTGLDLLGTGRSVVQGRETAVLKLYLSIDHDKVTLNKIKLKKLGDCPDTDIQAIKIVADVNSNGDYDSGDRLASSGSDVFSSGIAIINLSPAENIPQGTTTVCFIVLGMSQSAQPGKTVGIEINDNGYIELTLPDLVDTNGFPITSSIATIKDIRTPTTPIVVDGGLYTAIEDSLQARWTSAVGEGSIAESWYAIGTIPGATNLVNWTTAGSSTELNRIDLSLENGKTYYLAVKVKNSLGDYWSDIGVSNGITTDFIKPQLQEIPKITRVVSKGTLNDVVIKWPVADAGVSGIVKYEIQQREAKTPLWQMVKTIEISTGVAAGFIQPEIRGLNISATSLTYLVEGVLSGTYFYRVRAENGAGVVSDWAEMPSPVIAGNLPNELISEVSNYRNPFDSRKEKTIINFTLNQPSRVKIKIYDLFGYLVRELSAEGSAGSANNIEWDGTDTDGKKVAQGMYLAVIEAEGDNGSKGKATRRIGVIH